MSSDQFPRSRRSRDSLVAHNKLALYEDPIFDTPYETAVMIDDLGYPIPEAPDFINPAIVIDSEAEGLPDYFPDRLRIRIEYNPQSIDIDALARDIINEYDPEEVTIKSPSSWFDAEIDVEEIEKKIIGTAAGGNPLSGIDRDTLNKLPWLPYIGAIREWVKYPASGPEFTGEPEDIAKVAGILHRLPGEGESYHSAVGEMLKELVRKTGLIRQAKIIERVTAQVRTRDHAIKAGEDARRAFEDNERDEETFINDDGAFGSPEFFGSETERAKLNAGIRKHIPLVAADVTNTKVAKFFFDQRISQRQATMLLQQRQFDPTRVAKVLQLMAAYQQTSEK